jgi:hypothetical protein
MSSSHSLEMDHGNHCESDSDSDSLTMALTGSGSLSCGPSLTDRFGQLRSLANLFPTLLHTRSFNCELLFDVILCVLHESERLAIGGKNKRHARFVDFIRPFVQRLQQLQLKCADFEQLKVIGRGAFGQVALVKVMIHFD